MTLTTSTTASTQWDTLVVPLVCPTDSAKSPNKLVLAHRPMARCWSTWLPDHYSPRRHSHGQPSSAAGDRALRCAEHVLRPFEKAHGDDTRPRDVVRWWASCCASATLSGLLAA